MAVMTTGELAHQAGVNVETVRFYERRGLIPAPPRSAAGYRNYGEDTLARLRFILHAKVLGFELKEIKELLELRVQPGRTCKEVRLFAEEKIHDISSRIRSLERVRRALKSLSDNCTSRGPASECPFLDALD